MATNMSEKVSTEPTRVEVSDNEKTSVTQDHVERIAPASDIDETENANYEVNNKYAVKGDDSDGKINWTWKTITAALCLVLLYVGKLSWLIFSNLLTIL